MTFLGLDNQISYIHLAAQEEHWQTRRTSRGPFPPVSNSDMAKEDREKGKFPEAEGRAKGKGG